MNEYLEKIRHLKESEDHIEFKEAKKNFNYNGGEHKDPTKRRHCILGYVVALANECGGRLVFGMADHWPHEIVGTSYEKGNLGSLEDAIYEAMGIRVRIEECFDGDKRVVVFNVPSRPVGKLLKFEGVPLMRTGESLREMSDAEIFNILSEQEPDFSAKVCEGLTVNDLDKNAIRVMKNKYAEKQNNLSFRNLTDIQVLRDLELLVGDKLNYAALILLGKEEKLRQLLPQCSIVVEYRKNKSLIPYSAREEFSQPLFLAIDKVWSYLNQPLTNPEVQVKDLPYIFNVSAFNEESVREAILNAVVHRSFQIQSCVMIKQSPDMLTVLNPGGFPLGVNVNNILTVSSTPRCKRLSEVLQKTGLVERSGQGVDKMFSNAIADGKELPSYNGTDAYQVQLSFFAELKYPKLMRIVRNEQEKRGDDNALNVFQLIALYNVFRNETVKVDDDLLSQLKAEGLIGLCRGKYVIRDKGKNNNVANEPTERQLFIFNSMEYGRDYGTQELSRMLSQNVRSLQRDIAVLTQMGLIRREGIGKATRYYRIKDLKL